MLEVLKITGLLHIRSDVPDNIDPFYVNRLSIHDQNIQRTYLLHFKNVLLGCHEIRFLVSVDWCKKFYYKFVGIAENRTRGLYSWVKTCIKKDTR